MSTLRHELPVNSTQAAKALGLSYAYVNAIRRTLGMRSRYFFPSTIIKFLKNNPNFRMRDAYHARECPCDACVRRRADRAPQKPHTAKNVAPNPDPASTAVPGSPTPPSQPLEPASSKPAPPVQPPGEIAPNEVEAANPPVRIVAVPQKTGHSHVARALLHLMEKYRVSAKEITRRSTKTAHRFPSSYLSRILFGPQVYVGKAELEGLARVLSIDRREHFMLCRARLLDECPQPFQSQIQIHCTLDLPEGEAAYPLARLNRWGRRAVRACLTQQPAAFAQMIEALAVHTPAISHDAPVCHFARALKGFMAEHKVSGKTLTRETRILGHRLPSSWISRITSARQTWIEPSTLTLLSWCVTPDSVEQAELVRAHLYDECPAFAFPLVRVVVAGEDRSDESLIQRLSLQGRAALRRILDQAADPEPMFLELARHAGLNLNHSDDRIGRLDHPITSAAQTNRLRLRSAKGETANSARAQ